MRRRVSSATTERIIGAKLAAGRASERMVVEFLEALRGWDRRPSCVRCGDRNVYRMRSRRGGRNDRFLWRCRGCDSQYTVRAATVFEDSRVPLRYWCAMLQAACDSSVGISASEISRRTGVSNVTALFMMDRIRWALGSLEVVHNDDNDDAPAGGNADRLKLRGKWMTAMRRALDSAHREGG